MALEARPQADPPAGPHQPTQARAHVQPQYDCTVFQGGLSIFNKLDVPTQSRAASFNP